MSDRLRIVLDVILDRMGVTSLLLLYVTLHPGIDSRVIYRLAAGRACQRPADVHIHLFLGERLGRRVGLKGTDGMGDPGGVDRGTLWVIGQRR